jgi:hypothetical protein
MIINTRAYQVNKGTGRFHVSGKRDLTIYLKVPSEEFYFAN